ncbi:proline dehydrogenase family protein [Candidatus Acetothermia bacterium]|nr:proline dehydrogenase family protein [Candidatus Acetothermia bacterium]MBI3642901.1 proline dehydrogenase family protein [Candidatus Acetothermia bacterium]
MRQLLLALAANNRFKKWCTHFPPTRRLAHRFVAGEALPEALNEVKKLNQIGIKASLDHLGENVHTLQEAQKSAELYFEILDQVHAQKLDSNVSLKLTQMGLALDPDSCFETVRRVVVHAAKTNNFVRIDMEGSAYTDATLEIYKRLRDSGLNNVGVVIQAYLYRSISDVEKLLPIGLNVRLCKGAYAEPASVAFPKKADVDKSYLNLLHKLFSEQSIGQGTYVGIATHDEKIIQYVKEWTTANRIPKSSFEFQTLFGIRRDLQIALSQEGYRVRVYVSFGSEWYPYFMRRLAERPANIFFIAKNLFRD